MSKEAKVSSVEASPKVEGKQIETVTFISRVAIPTLNPLSYITKGKIGQAKTQEIRPHPLGGVEFDFDGYTIHVPFSNISSIVWAK